MNAITIIEEHRSGKLHRRRPQDDAAFVRFGPDPTDNFEAFVCPQVLRQVYAHTQAAKPNETIGLLAGRDGYDDTGPYTLVTSAEAARDGEAKTTPNSVHLPAKSRQQIEQRLCAQAPTVDTVGWWHSHPHQSAIYSSIDEQEQQTWGDNHAVGLVMSGHNVTEPVAVYRGPGAIPLAINGPLPVLTTPPVEAEESTQNTIPVSGLQRLKITSTRSTVTVHIWPAIAWEAVVTPLLAGVGLVTVLLVPGMLMTAAMWLTWFLLR